MEDALRMITESELGGYVNWHFERETVCTLVFPAGFSYYGAPIRFASLHQDPYTWVRL